MSQRSTDAVNVFFCIDVETDDAESIDEAGPRPVGRG